MSYCGLLLSPEDSRVNPRNADPFGNADADLGVMVGEVFGDALGKRGDEDALVVGGAVADLGERAVDLAFDGADFFLRVKRSR